jgi:hypothetical protein
MFLLYSLLQSVLIFLCCEGGLFDMCTAQSLLNTFRLRLVPSVSVYVY